MKKQLPRAGLIVVGDELLQGRRADKHFGHARSVLEEWGIDVGWLYYLGDDVSLLTEHFQAVRKRGDICFCFGGIGATPDDVTRQAMARAHGLELVRHPEAVSLIEEKFGSGAYPNRILMAELPKGARLVPNAYNNIPGFFIDKIYCLPGFPEMAWPMMRWILENRLFDRRQEISYFSSFVVFDVRESELIDMLESAQVRYPRVKISSLPHFPGQGKWQLELGARGIEEEVRKVIALLRHEVSALGGTIAAPSDG